MERGARHTRCAGECPVWRRFLPEAGRTEYRLRSEHHVGGLATLEAIARALRVLEGDAGVATEDALLELFRIMVARTLWLRGQRSCSTVLPATPGGHKPAAT